MPGTTYAIRLDGYGWVRHNGYVYTSDAPQLFSSKEDVEDALFVLYGYLTQPSLQTAIGSPTWEEAEPLIEIVTVAFQTLSPQPTADFLADVHEAQARAN